MNTKKVTKYAETITTSTASSCFFKVSTKDTIIARKNLYFSDKEDFYVNQEEKGRRIDRLHNQFTFATKQLLSFIPLYIYAFKTLYDTVTFFFLLSMIQLLKNTSAQLTYTIFHMSTKMSLSQKEYYQIQYVKYVNNAWKKVISYTQNEKG